MTPTHAPATTPVTAATVTVSTTSTAAAQSSASAPQAARPSERFTAAALSLASEHPLGRAGRLAQLYLAMMEVIPAANGPTGALVDAMFDRAGQIARDEPHAPPDVPIAIAALQVVAPWVREDGALDIEGMLRSHPDARPLLEAVATGVRSPDPYSLGPREHRLPDHLMFLGGVDAALKDALVAGLAQIPKSMPALDLVLKGVEGRPFADHIVFGVQHLLGSQLPLFDALTQLGVEPSDVHLLGVPYSTNDMVASLCLDRGFHVDEGRARLARTALAAGDYHEERSRQIVSHLEALVKKAEKTGKKILVLDDGGLVTRAISERFPDKAHVFSVVEQTSRGITEAKKVAVEHTLVDVAWSPGKTAEAVHIAHRVTRALVSELADLGIRKFDGVPVTLAGYGRVGRLVALSLKELGFTVKIVEEDSDAGRQKLAAAAADGFLTGTGVDAYRGARVVLGMSGFRSITREALAAMDPGVIIGSTSSAEIEVDVAALREGAMSLADRGATQDYAFAGKTVVLLKDGRPLNFDGLFHGVLPEVIQLTEALMLLGALQAVRSPNKGIEALDEAPQKGVIDLVVETADAMEVRPLPVRARALTMPTSPPVQRPIEYDERVLLMQRWNDFLGSVPDVFPRSLASRNATGQAVFRDHEGRLFGLDLSDWHLRPTRLTDDASLPDALRNFVARNQT